MVRNMEKRISRFFDLRISRIFIALTLLMIFCVSFLPLIPASAKSNASAKSDLSAKSDSTSATVAKPKFSVKKTSAGNGVKLTISKTAGAEGYRVYMKMPGTEKYKLVKTIKKDGMAKRSYTRKKLADGTYEFKIRACHSDADGKTVWDGYSDAQKVIIRTGKSLHEEILTTPEVLEFVNAMGLISTEAGKDNKTEINPIYYDIQPKKDAELPGNLVYRLYAIKEDESDYDINPDVSFDETSCSILPRRGYSGELCLMAFAYVSEEDAVAHINPVACTGHFRIMMGQFDNNGNPDNPAGPPVGEPEQIKYADITFKNGYAYFGSYPQKKVTDSTDIAALNKLAASGNSQIITYNGSKYIYADSSKIWCKEAPVEWIILKGSAESDSVTLMSSKVLLECGFSSWKGFEAGGTWKDSFVRNHLNGYSGRFDNIWSFDFFGVLFEGNIQRVLMEQTCGDCSDKVLLPSKKQLSKLTATERIRKASDLCKKADNKGYWCVDSDGKGNITAVTPKGEFTTYKAYCQDGQGYVPVIKVDLTQCNVIVK